VSGTHTNLSFEKTGKYDLPVVLGPLVELINSRDSRALQSVLTFLECSKLIQEWKRPDLETVTAPANIDPDLLKEWNHAVPGQLRL
jgi:hypothetical protein